MMQRVYSVWHYETWDVGTPEMGDREEMNPKFIGVYSSEENAKAVVDHLMAQPGFCDWPNGFEVDLFPLDSTGWDGGFTSIDEWYKELEESGELGEGDDQ